MTKDAARATELLQALLGKALERVCVGVADLQLRFSDGQAVQLESAVVVEDGEPVEPYSLTGLALLVPLLNSEVATADVDVTGRLTMTLGETTVRCAADERYEAWSYTGLAGARVVVMPGGELAFWSRR